MCMASVFSELARAQRNIDKEAGNEGDGNDTHLPVPVLVFIFTATM